MNQPGKEIRMNEEENTGDNEVWNQDDWTRDLFRLSSNRADTVPNWQRRLWMDQFEELLRSDQAVRLALAEWKGKCFE